MVSVFCPAAQGKSSLLSATLHVMSSLDLKAALRRSGMSQFDLARSSGVHPSTISRACSAGMELSPDAERRVREVIDPPSVTNTPITVQVAADA